MKKSNTDLNRVSETREMEYDSNGDLEAQGQADNGNGNGNGNGVTKQRSFLMNNYLNKVKDSSVKFKEDQEAEDDDDGGGNDDGGSTSRPRGSKRDGTVVKKQRSFFMNKYLDKVKDSSKKFKEDQAAAAGNGNGGNDNGTTSRSLNFPEADEFERDGGANFRRNPNLAIDDEHLTRTVNNLTRMNEALAFLDDKGFTLDEKRAAVMKQNGHGVTALFWAIRRGADYSLIQKMVDIGGLELVLLSNTYGENALHNAAFCGASYEVFKLLVDVGGRKLILLKDRLGNTSLHYTCAWGTSFKATEYLADVGGREALMTENNKTLLPTSKTTKVQQYLSTIGGPLYDAKVVSQKDIDLSIFHLIMSNKTEEAEWRLDDKRRHAEILKQDENGLNPLMVANWFIGNASQSYESRLASLIRKMVLVGGKDLVLQQNKTKSNAIHYACFNGAPLGTIMVLVEAAGNENLQFQNTWCSTPLHDACYRQASVEVIEYLVNVGGTEPLVAINNMGQTPLDILFDADIQSDEHILTFQNTWYNLDKNCTRDVTRNIIRKTLNWTDGVHESYVTSNNFLKVLLNELFIQPRYQMIIMFDLYAQLLIILILSPLCLNDVYRGNHNNGGDDDDDDPYLTLYIIILTICISYYYCREMIQLYSSPIQGYSQSYMNLFDTLQLVFITYTIVILILISYGAEMNTRWRLVLVMTTAVSWIELLFVFGQVSYSVSVFTYASVQIILKLAPFIFTAVVLALAFSQMYFIAGAGGDQCSNDMLEWQCSFGSSLFQSISMLLSTNYQFMQYMDYIGENFLLTIVSFAFAFTVGILLLNILIAVINNVFTKVSDKSENAFWTTRLDFMIEVNTIRNGMVSCITPDNRFSKSQVVRAGHHNVLRAKRIRKKMSQYDDEWMKRCEDPELKDFYKWWYYSWKRERPPFKTRLYYFYLYASSTEVIFPGKVFQNIVFGLKYDEQLEGFKAAIGMILGFIHLFLGMVVSIVILILGFLTLGFLWPKAFNELLFFGPIESNKDSKKSRVAKKTDRIEVLEEQMIELQQQNAEILGILLKVHGGTTKYKSKPSNPGW